MATEEYTDPENPDPISGGKAIDGIDTSETSTLAPTTQTDVVAQVVENVSNPEIPTEGIQVYEDLDTGAIAGGSQFASETINADGTTSIDTSSGAFSLAEWEALPDGTHKNATTGEIVTADQWANMTSQAEAGTAVGGVATSGTVEEGTMEADVINTSRVLERLVPRANGTYYDPVHDRTYTQEQYNNLFSGPSMEGATGTVSTVIEGQTGELSHIADGAQGTVNPEDLVDPVTGEVDPDMIVTAATDTDFGVYTINDVPRMAAATMDTVTGEAAQGIAAQTDIDKAIELIDVAPAEAVAEVAALPQEALVTTQLNNLLVDLEGGKTPAWAAPAVAQVEAALAARGMSTSTIARDSLFNAIIQSAFPLAQNNATALQQRAAQNLSNKQEAAMLNAQFEQQTGMQMSQNVANFLSENTQLRQQMEVANMTNRQQMEMAEMEYEWNTNRENMNSKNLAKLENMRAELQVAQTNAQIKTNLGLANLTNEQQAALANAQSHFQMGVLNMTNEQQAEMANSQFYQTMNLTNLNNNQQAAMQNAVAWAAMDQQNLTNLQQAQVENARNFLAMDMANLSNEQQAAVINMQTRVQTMLSDQGAKNAAAQINAQNETQANVVTAQLATQASIATANMATSASQTNASLSTQVSQFNSQQQFARDQFNSTMYAQLEQSNVQWRRQMNTIDTAGENAVNQANAINAFNLSNQALTWLWGDLRDAATWSHQATENDKEAQLRLALATMSSDSAVDAIEANYDITFWTTVGKFLTGLLPSGTTSGT